MAKVDRVDIVCAKHNKVLLATSAGGPVLGPYYNMYSSDAMDPGFDGIWGFDLDNMECPDWTEDDECQDDWEIRPVED